MKFINTILFLTLALTAMPASAQTYVIENAKVHTLGSLGSMDTASILIEDGQIIALGEEVEVPDDATVIDGSGKQVTPGIFDSYSYLGLVEISLEDRTVDNEQAHYGPAFAVVDAFNPRSSVVTINRIEGITRALLVPESHREGQLLAGTASVVHLGGGDQYIETERAAIVAFLGDTGSRMAGGSRAAAVLKIREALLDATDYLSNKSDYQTGNTRDYVLGKHDMDALQPLLNGDIPLIVSANRVSDINAALSIGEEFDLRLIIKGGSEAWMIADKLAGSNTGVLLNPIENLPEQFESLNANLQNAIKLNDAGVTIAFTYSDSHNARNLTQVAGNAVANGLPWDAALRAITTNPANLLMGDEDCCTLEPGHKAELVVWDGDPLEVTSFPDHVFIAGKKISMKSRQTLLRDRYLDLTDELPFAYRK